MTLSARYDAKSLANSAGFLNILTCLSNFLSVYMKNNLQYLQRQETGNRTSSINLRVNSRIFPTTVRNKAPHLQGSYKDTAR